MRNKAAYLLLLIPILTIILSPRFGWKIHNYDATVFRYAGTTFIDGMFHSKYINGEDLIDIGYEGIFSKRFNITIDDTNVYYMEVGIDGEVIDFAPEMLHFTSNDIVWNDICGIFYWRYLLTIIMALAGIKLFRYAGAKGDENRKAIYVCGAVIYIIAMLISLRIIF